MIESLFFLGGVIVGGLVVHTGYFAGTRIIHKTYVELTQPPEIDNIDIEVDKRPTLPEGYDWDSYDSYILRSEEEDDVIPES